MSEIWNFFENMNEYVYVSDADTHELIYMNKKMRDTYGCSSHEDYQGKFCYRVLQNNSAPCAICNNQRLKPGQFIEWKHYNPLINKYIMIKDTVQEENGRRYRIEIAIDISAEKFQNIGNSYENLEALINEGLRVALQTASPDEALNVVLEYIGNALNGQRTYVFEKNASGGDDNTYEWISAGVTPEKDNLQNLPPEVCAGWYQRFNEKETVTIENLEDFKERDPLLYEVLERQNIHSLVVVPLYSEGKVIGFYGVDNPPRQSIEYAANMLQIMGHFIVSCIKRRNVVRELQRMSYCDQLTGLGNRHAMNEYMKQVDMQEEVGVVYCDITGLKKVNDEEGHMAGDQLIHSAAQCVKRAFDGYGVFRIGGDELLVLGAGMEEERFCNAVALLKEELRKKDLAMAIGTVWEKDSHNQTKKLLAKAESRMYADKRAYYSALGIDRRK